MSNSQLMGVEIGKDGTIKKQFNTREELERFIEDPEVKIYVTNKNPQECKLELGNQVQDKKHIVQYIAPNTYHDASNVIIQNLHSKLKNINAVLHETLSTTTEDDHREQ